jgi:hypothetical protein
MNCRLVIPIREARHQRFAANHSRKWVVASIVGGDDQRFECMDDGIALIEPTAPAGLPGHQGFVTTIGLPITVTLMRATSTKRVDHWPRKVSERTILTPRDNPPHENGGLHEWLILREAFFSEEAKTTQDMPVVSSLS